jgi:acyl-CoA reductase-like NAD-dependent aldehyde dehydrogenase
MLLVLKASDVDPGSEITQDEIIGPVLIVIGPFGGLKQSEVGREMGVAGLEVLERKPFAAAVAEAAAR